MTVYTIRQARLEDVNCVLELVYSSGSECLDWVYGGGSKDRAIAFLKHCYEQNNTPFSHTHIQVVEAHNQIVGVFSIATEAHAQSMGGPFVAEIFRYFGFSWGAWVYFKSIRLERSLPAPKPSCLHLSNVAVKADYRRKGVLKYIVEVLDKHAFEAHLEYISLDVAKNNAIALTAYQALGFNLQYSRPAPHKSVPGYHYLRRRTQDYELDE